MSETKTKIVKKYANRKLYDTEESSYISLKKLVECVASGREVQVIDNVTQTDITGQTLLTAIVEREETPIFEVETLKGIIRAGSISKYAETLKGGTNG